MGLGFDLAESLSGTYHLFDDPLTDFEMRLSLRLGAFGLRQFARQRHLRVEGLIHARGLAENGGNGRPISGRITWKLIDELRVPYALTFTGDDAATYHLKGQRDFFVYDVLGSLRAMTASLYDAKEAEIGRARLLFEPEREFTALLKSFRPRLRRGE